MPHAAATVDQTVTTTTDTCIFQSDRHVIANGLKSGITTPGDGSIARGIRIRCPSGSAATLRVRIEPHHATSTYAFLKAGESGEYYDAEAVFVSAASGTATYNYEVFA